MLDFDKACGRVAPSVAGVVYPFAGDHFQKFYWGTEEKLMPVYQSLAVACAKHPEVPGRRMSSTFGRSLGLSGISPGRARGSLIRDTPGEVCCVVFTGTMEAATSTPL